jgi:DNA-binding transcriptional MerR regulator
MPGKKYTLTELAEAAGITGRTIRYYIAQGVLQNPVSQGCNAHYTEEHLERLRFIKTHQERGASLAEIKAHLGNEKLRVLGSVVIQIPIRHGVVVSVDVDYFSRHQALVEAAMRILAQTLNSEEHKS